MRIACLGDLHIRETRPENRIDNFFKTLFGKLKFVYNYCLDNDVQVILLPGDVFNSPIQPYPILIRTLNLFHGIDYAKIKIFACYGQHDLLFHNKNNRDVALNVLESGKAVRILDAPVNYNGVNIYGCHYGDEIPEITTEGLNILVIHKMIIAEKKLWRRQERFTKSSSLLRKHNFDLIVAGDNHNTFQDVYRNRYLVNAGSLMRTNIDQEEHKPCFFIYDINKEQNKVQKIEIPIIPFHKVFKEKEKKTKEVVFDDKFTSEFINSEDIDIDFKKNVISTMDKISEKDLNQETREIIQTLFT